MDTEVYTSSSEEETIALGRELAPRLNPGDTVAFYGDLGAGKTEFIKGICERLGVEEIVSSPTYTIVNEYTLEEDRRHFGMIFHVDLYRLERPEDLREIGLAEMLANPTALKLVEWPEHSCSLLPPCRWEVILTPMDDESARRVEIVHRDMVMQGAAPALVLR